MSTAADPVASAWDAVLLLAEAVRQRNTPVRSCSLLVGAAPEVRLDSIVPPPGDGWPVSILLDPATGVAPALSDAECRYALEDLIVMRRLSSGSLPPPAADLLELYVPYCLASLHARAARRPFTVSHFAQSLDGRIATGVGDSRWIGCDENLVHAHRMRALCEGILIGAGTLRRDRPALTVRHAPGRDPVRIVVGGAGDVGCLSDAGPSPIVVLDDRGDGRASTAQVRHVALPRSNGHIPTSAILGALYEQGILSVYIEGGAVTTSAFLAEGNIDVLQLHISPMIIGPGINSFAEPAIHSVTESVKFAPYRYHAVGDGMMFVGRVAS
ncbi:MAG: RibD family protein [Acidimicrobiia bacterium]|nr:RibD family protein [Acidimicrobiia bacterium]